MTEDRNEEDELPPPRLQAAGSNVVAPALAPAERPGDQTGPVSSGELLRVTLASIGDAVVTTDAQGRVVSLNKVAEALTGWAEGEARERPLREIFRILDEKTRRPAGDPAEQALRQGCVVGLASHTVLVGRDGVETPIDDSAAPIRDGEGRVHGVVLVFRSVAERRRAEKALEESKQELEDFFENASVGLHWVGPDGTILRVNQAELDMLGYRREEYLGHHIAEFHADADAIADVLRRLAARETLRDHEARMRCKDGSVKDVLIDSSVLWDGDRFVHTRCFTRDVTHRKRAEETQARLAAIVEGSQDAIVGKTLDGRIRSWNAGAEALFGYRAEEIVGEPIQRLIPEERQDEEERILERLRRGERVEHYETVRVAKNGNLIDVSLTISPIRDGAGRIVGASKIARDITERKRTQQRLATQHGVTQALAGAADLREAVPLVLAVICEQLGWQLGALWCVDERERVLRCVETYHRPGVEVPRFEADTRDRAMPRGVGLPGRVWATGAAAFIPDVVGDANFARGAIAAAEGLHAGVGFPIALGDELLGVMEFFDGRIRPPDQDLLRVMTAVGSQIGQFIERRRAEAALRESERRFRVMADAVPSMIWTAAADGTITYANDRWFGYCGLSPEENARGWPELVLHPEDRERCLAAWRASLRDGTPYEIEVRNRRRDGTYRWFVTRAVPLRDATGAVAQWVGTTNDVDDRKRTEQTTRFLAEASAALASLTDENTLQIVASLAVPRFADWCAVDVLGIDGAIRRLAVAHADPAKVELVRELDRRSPSSAPERHGVRHVIRTGQAEWAAAIPDELLAELTHGEEHLRIVREVGFKSYISVPLKSRNRVLGALTFVVGESGRSYDPTDVGAAEDLASRAVIAIENANLLATLRDADRRKDEFLAMLAHELRNPLAPIRNAAQILRAKGGKVAELGWATDVIDRQVQQMTRLVDDLLDVSRITRGKIELRRERVELAAVVRSAVEASRPLVEKRGHELTITMPAEPVRLEADPARLAQVFSNILTNAAKYTDHGGHIRITVEPRGGDVVVRVRDDGIGIPRDALPHIFDMFTQVRGSVERSDGGLGIGLTLVKRLVELHGGAVEAHSEGPGRGSEFLVRLPRTIEPERRRDAPPGAGLAAGPPRRILVVDDNRDAADTLGTLLELSGNEVRVTYDGVEAVRLAAEFHPDVIVLDLGLPRLSGYDAARQIREQPGGDETLLVALTGWGQEDDRRRSREAGFDEHLTKPVEFEALLQLLAATAPRRDGGPSPEPRVLPG